MSYGCSYKVHTYLGLGMRHEAGTMNDLQVRLLSKDEWVNFRPAFRAKVGWPTKLATPLSVHQADIDITHQIKINTPGNEKLDVGMA